MDLNEKLQAFVRHIPRYIWNALDGKYDVTIDIVRGSRCQELPAIVVYKQKEKNYSPFIRELFEAFQCCETDYGGSFEVYAESIAQSVTKREDFCFRK